MEHLPLHASSPSPRQGLLGDAISGTGPDVSALPITEDYLGRINDPDGQSGNASSYQVGLAQPNYVHLSSTGASASPRYTCVEALNQSHVPLPRSHLSN